MDSRMMPTVEDIYHPAYPSWRFSPNYVNGHWVQCQESWYHQAKRAVSPKSFDNLVTLCVFQLPWDIFAQNEKALVR